MSYQTSDTPGRVPQWTAADRFRKARTEAHLSQSELADLCDIDPNTVSNYETGATTKLRKSVVNRWAFATQVPAQWLRDGTEPVDAPDPTGGTGTPGQAERQSGWTPRVVKSPARVSRLRAA